MRHVKRLHLATDTFKRALIAWTLLLTLGTGFSLWSANTAFDRSLQQMREDVTRCFLSPGRLRPAPVAQCGREFDDPETPQNDYLEVQGQSRQNLKVFGDLIRRVERLEAEQKSGR